MTVSNAPRELKKSNIGAVTSCSYHKFLSQNFMLTWLNSRQHTIILRIVTYFKFYALGQQLLYRRNNYSGHISLQISSWIAVLLGVSFARFYPKASGIGQQLPDQNLDQQRERLAYKVQKYATNTMDRPH